MGNRDSSLQTTSWNVSVHQLIFYISCVIISSSCICLEGGREGGKGREGREGGGRQGGRCDGGREGTTIICKITFHNIVFAYFY